MTALGQADPAAYVQQTFPSVAEAWANSGQPNGVQAALAATAAAQQQLGITNMKLLPASVAERAVASFQNPELPEQERVNALTNLIMATPDAAQQRALFEQLVEAGIPEYSEGALSAALRGDTAAAKRLFQAALFDPSKLPGKIPETAASISQEIQSQLMAPGTIGDAFYGLSDGEVQNFDAARRDAQLLNNAVSMRLLAGEGLSAAVAAVSKDIYGDVHVVNGNWGVNAQLVLPRETDPAPILSGLEALKEDVRAALTFDVPGQVGNQKAVIDAATTGYVDSVIADGYFRNTAQGYVFIDPFVGAAVVDASGDTLVFSEEQVFAAAEARQDMAEPSSVQIEDAAQNEWAARNQMLNQVVGGDQ